MAYYNILLSTCLLFLLTACHIDKSKSKWDKVAEHVVNKYINNQIYLPDTINPNNNKNLDSIYNSEFKLTINIDIDCSSCLNKIEFWEKFSILTKEKVPILFYINAFDGNNISKRIDKLTSLEWVYDKEQLFVAINGLYDTRFQTVLTDKNNKVILIGDPSENKKLEQLYINTIFNITNKK